ncbi:MAG: dihydrolipoyllysine-residue acetyltransferase [Agarilytica sp.]
MAKQTITVPDIGGAEDVEVIEIAVSVGDSVEVDDSILTLESDKASMDVPSPSAGTIASILVKVGDNVSEGSAIIELEENASSAVRESSSETKETSAAQASEKMEEKAAELNPEKAEPPAAGATSSMEVRIPDIGGAEGVDVIEVCVNEGDEVEEGDSILVLESDKASMEVPSPASGKISKIDVKEGEKVSEGDLVLHLSTSADVNSGASLGGGSEESSNLSSEVPVDASTEIATTEITTTKTETTTAPSIAQFVGSESESPQATHERLPKEIMSAGSNVYAGPAVRKLARQLGVNLGEVKAAGPRGRISKDDIKAYVKTQLQARPDNSAGVLSQGVGIPQIPEVDFARFGDVEIAKLSKIQKLTSANMIRNWLNVPHVTQFDDADITDLEDFRASMKAEAEKKGFKLTPLPFLLKACAMALNHEPGFNVSLHADGEHIVRKKYVHIGVAVATSVGLVVPVIRDVDKKGLLQLAQESNEFAQKARDGKLLPKDMQGGCFTISSLGAVGGTGFTPIINSPEVAILGVSKASTQPVWDGAAFIPRKMLPLSLSYDHRAINGADAGRFFTYLTTLLADVRRLSL